MTSYVRSNIIMKALWRLCQTPLYISEKIFTKWNWEDFRKFTNTNKKIDFEHKIIERIQWIYFFDKFEKMLKKHNTKTLKYNLIINNNNKSLTITPNEDFLFKKLFQDTYYEKYNFPTLLFGHSRPPLKCSYKKFTQLSNANRKFAYHVTIKLFIRFILSYTWIRIRK
jgi:hypothetical protein